MPALLVSIRFHEGRYHGSGEWPPSPARLFQALIAGAGRGERLSSQAVEALSWLERLKAPAIAGPSSYAGQPLKSFVPNNDLDAVGGDPARVSEIRAAKIIRPHLFDASVPLIYAWTFEGGAEAERHARTLCEIAEDLYQLGRGVDMAWATGKIVPDAAEVEAQLRAHGGVLWKSNEGGDGKALSCPHPGSLARLTRRFEATRKRFEVVGQGRRISQLFRQAPKPDFRLVPYNSPSTVLLFDIRQGNAFAPQPVESIVALTERIRDRAALRLRVSIWRRDDPKRDSCIDKIFIGRWSGEADKSRRIQITPLPSIGHEHADRLIRRVLVTVPPDCPIAAADIAWAFSGVEIGSDQETGEITELVPSADSAMLSHYEAGGRLWRTVTPAALPERAARRHIDPSRVREESKGGSERTRENAKAAMAVRQALRHTGVEALTQAIRVQREPFEGKGRRVEGFAAGPRFYKERLWHVEISFAEAVQGPLLIGDGRYLGLGLMAPVGQVEGVIAFTITEGLEKEVDPLGLTRALRRAAMARVQERTGREALPGFFTGHAADGAPLSRGRHEHLAFVFDARRRRLLIVAPHVLDHREASKKERAYLRVLEEALGGFRELRAGSAGKLALVPTAVDLSDDPLFKPSAVWETVIPYHVTRHQKLRDASAAVEADLLLECLRAGFPRPRIEVLETFGKRGLGLFGRAKLRFCSAVAGPLLLGRDRHFGGGLFIAA